jgi:hypothetical protein
VLRSEVTWLRERVEDSRWVDWLIGWKNVAGRSVGHCSRMVSGSFVQIFAMGTDPFGRAGVCGGVTVVTGNILMTISV